MRRTCTLLAILLLLDYTARSAGLPTLNGSGAAAIDRMFQAAVDKREIPGVVTSAGIMMLYEQGKLRLDDPVGNYLPAFKGRPVMTGFNETDATYTTRPAKGEMTIRHLLAHTSGLSYPFTSPTVNAITTKTGKDPQELPLLFDPGTKWQYSPATAVLGDILVKLSGQSIEDWDQARIFRPLGMVDTTYSPTPERAARLATIHQR